MRAPNPFSLTLLLCAFLTLMLSVLVPWWASLNSLQQQAQTVQRQFAQASEHATASANVADLIELSSPQPLSQHSQAWWFGSLGANQEVIQAGSPLFYRLNTQAASHQWLTISAPLVASSLAVFGLLYRRFRRTQQAEHLYLQTLLQDSSTAHINQVQTHPIAAAIISLHQAQHQQLNAIKQQLQIAQQQSFQDSLTLLGNRFAFQRDLVLALNDEDKLASATLMIMRATSLQDINLQHGFQAGDQYLLDLVTIIRKTIQPEMGAKAYRISGTELAVLFNGPCESLAQRLGERLKQELYHYQHIHKLACAAYVGFTQLLSGQKAEHVLTRADLALAQAQSEEPNSWSMLLRQDAADSMGESQWRQRLQSMLDDDQVLLQVQPAQIYKTHMPGYNEIYTRFPNSHGGTYPASTVFAMLQRLNMSMLFEQKIIDMILHKISQTTEKNQRWAINLTPTSLQQNSFLIWLERTLLRDRGVTSKLVFELDEQVLQHQLAASQRLLEVIRSAGARYAVSRFGQGYGSFRLLKTIKPDYVKLEGQLVRELDQDHTSQQFVRMIVDLAQRLGCAVIAEGVETVAQKQLLESMHIDGVQGYLIAKPVDFAQFKALS